MLPKNSSPCLHSVSIYNSWTKFSKCQFALKIPSSYFSFSIFVCCVIYQTKNEEDNFGGHIWFHLILCSKSRSWSMPDTCQKSLQFQGATVPGPENPRWTKKGANELCHQDNLPCHQRKIQVDYYLFLFKSSFRCLKCFANFIPFYLVVR